jgi:transcription initiation factor TFIIIB Brf1 subunit/transcription initiation factor TFIIB
MKNKWDIRMSREPLGSTIPDSNRDKYPNFKFDKMLKYNNQSISTSKHKSSSKAIIIMRTLVSKIGIGIIALNSQDIITKEALRNYDKIFELKMIKGRSIELASIVSLYHACRVHRKPITIEEILKQSDSKFTVKQTEKYYRKVITSFENDIDIYTDLEKIADNIIIKMALTNEIYTKVLIKLEEIKQKRINIGKPNVFVASIIYLVAKDSYKKITQTAISKASGISQKAISLRCKYIRTFDTNGW